MLALQRFYRSKVRTGQRSLKKIQGATPKPLIVGYGEDGSVDGS